MPSVLAVEGRVALTLRVGLRPHHRRDCACRFWCRKDLGQRIFRAKKALSEARVPLRRHVATSRGAGSSRSCRRLPHLQRGIHRNPGDEWMRAALRDDALRLGRILAELLPPPSRRSMASGADGVAGIAQRGARGPTEKPFSTGSGPLVVGPRADPARYGCARARAAARWRREATPCRQPLPPVTRAPTPPRRPTGAGSCFSMTPCFRSAPLRSWR